MNRFTLYAGAAIIILSQFCVPAHASSSDLLERYEAYCQSLPCVSYDLEVTQQMDSSRTVSGTPRQNTYRGTVVEDDGEFVARQNYLAMEQARVIWNHDSTVVRKADLMCFASGGTKGAYETPQTPRDRTPYVMHLALRAKTHLTYSVQIDDRMSISEAIRGARRVETTVDSSTDGTQVYRVEYFMGGECASVVLKFRMEGDNPLLVSLSRRASRDCVPILERTLTWARVGNYFFIERVDQEEYHSNGGAPYQSDTLKVDVSSITFDPAMSASIALSEVGRFPKGSMTYTFADRSVALFGAEMIDGEITPVLDADGKLHLLEGKDGGY